MPAYLLADTEAAEDPAQQILAGELPGDLVERLLRAAQLLGHQLTGAAVAQPLLRLRHLPSGAAEGIEMPLPGGDRAGLQCLVTHAGLQVRTQGVQSIARQGRERNPWRTGEGVGYRDPRRQVAL